MGSITNGILGGFSGKVGTVVGYTLGGKQYMRSLPKARTRFTPRELANQAMFKMVKDYLAPLKDLVRVGFKNYFTKTGGYRAAVSYTRKVAMVKDDAGFYIDPALFKISGGNLEGAVNPSVSFQGPNLMHFNWDFPQGSNANGSDQAMVLVYDMINFRALTRIFDGTFRKEGTLRIEIPDDFKGKETEVYIGFVAADRFSQSDSQYLGKAVIP